MDRARGVFGSPACDPRAGGRGHPPRAEPRPTTATTTSSGRSPSTRRRRPSWPPTWCSVTTSSVRWPASRCPVGSLVSLVMSRRGDGILDFREVGSTRRRRSPSDGRGGGGAAALVLVALALDAGMRPVYIVSAKLTSPSPRSTFLSSLPLALRGSLSDVKST